MSAARLAALVLTGLLGTGALACKKDDPKASKDDPAPASDSVAAAPPVGSDAPTAEEFCAHIDKLSMTQMAGMPGTPEEKQQMIDEGHASCVAASSEDRKNYPEWGPCARCAMTVDDLGTMEQKCDSVCKALGDKLDKKTAPAPH